MGNEYMEHFREKLGKLKEDNKITPEDYKEARVHAAGKTDVDQDPNEEQIDEYEKAMTLVKLLLKSRFTGKSGFEKPSHTPKSLSEKGRFKAASSAGFTYPKGFKKGDVTENEKEPVVEDEEKCDKLEKALVLHELQKQMDPGARQAMHGGDPSDVATRRIERLSKALALRNLIKERIYVGSPSEAPKGAKVQRGKRGGLYYEGKAPIDEGKKGSSPAEQGKFTGFRDLDKVDLKDHATQRLTSLANSIRSEGFGVGASAIEDTAEFINATDNPEVAAKALERLLGRTYFQSAASADQIEGINQLIRDFRGAGKT